VKRIEAACEQASLSAAHFLRGASGFGVVVFREETQPIAPAPVERAGHADCLSLLTMPVGWAWQDPRVGDATRAKEGDR